MRPVLRFLHDTAAAGVSDADLLRRYAAANDEAAFELLVRRHAAAVWAACRRILPADSHAAEDAFQATFLALARKSDAVRTGCVAGWLYRVAVHAALKARRARGTISLDPSRGQDTDATNSEDPGALTAAAEQAAVVHEELARLGEKYRLPVVLCDLTGLTHGEAAAQLGWPVGTVSGRLVRGREQLRRRLERRGVTLAVTAVTSVLAANETNASTALTRAAVAAGTTGAATPAVLSLAEGVLRAMRVAKLKVIGLVGAAAVAAVGGLALLPAFGPATRAADDPAPGGAAARKADAPEKLEEVLLDLEKKSWESMKDGGASGADVLAEDFVALMIDGNRLTRTGFLNLLADVRLKEYSLTDVKLTRLTPDAAVLTYKAKLAFTYKGDEVKQKLWVSSTWAKRDGKWVSVVYHETETK